MSLEPLRGAERCLFHWVIISRGSFLGDCIWGIAQGCVGKRGLLEAKGGGKKAGWGQNCLDNCLNLVKVTTAEKR